MAAAAELSVAVCFKPMAQTAAAIEYSEDLVSNEVEASFIAYLSSCYLSAGLQS